MDEKELKILNIARRIGVFNCLFNHRYGQNILTQDTNLNDYLLKERDKLEIIIKNGFEGVEVDSLLSSPKNRCTANVNDIIVELNFLLDGN